MEPYLALGLHLNCNQDLAVGEARKWHASARKHAATRLLDLRKDSKFRTRTETERYMLVCCLMLRCTQHTDGTEVRAFHAEVLYDMMCVSYFGTVPVMKDTIDAVESLTNGGHGGGVSADGQEKEERGEKKDTSKTSTKSPWSSRLRHLLFAMTTLRTRGPEDVIHPVSGVSPDHLVVQTFIRTKLRSAPLHQQALWTAYLYGIIYCQLGVNTFVHTEQSYTSLDMPDVTAVRLLCALLRGAPADIRAALFYTKAARDDTYNPLAHIFNLCTTLPNMQRSTLVASCVFEAYLRHRYQAPGRNVYHGVFEYPRLLQLMEQTVGDSDAAGFRDVFEATLRLQESDATMGWTITRLMIGSVDKVESDLSGRHKVEYLTILDKALLSGDADILYVVYENRTMLQSVLPQHADRCMNLLYLSRHLWVKPDSEGILLNPHTFHQTYMNMSYVWRSLTPCDRAFMERIICLIYLDVMRQGYRTNPATSKREEEEKDGTPPSREITSRQAVFEYLTEVSSKFPAHVDWMDAQEDKTKAWIDLLYKDDMVAPMTADLFE
jgi:hypothetical protein